MCKIMFVAYIDFKSIAEQLAGGIFCELPKSWVCPGRKVAVLMHKTREALLCVTLPMLKKNLKGADLLLLSKYPIAS